MTDRPANDKPERSEIRLPTDLKAMLLVGIFSLLFLYALYITSEILVPVIIGFLLKMVLQPATDMLVAFHFLDAGERATLLGMLRRAIRLLSGARSLRPGRGA